MMHFISHSRHVFHEARLLRFAGETPEPPVDAPKPPEAKPATPEKKEAVKPDPNATRLKAMERIKASGAAIKPLREEYQKYMAIQARVEAGAKITDKELADHKLKDEGEAGLKDDVDAKVKDLEAKMEPLQKTLNEANADSENALKEIEAKGPFGKVEAAFMRVEAVMNDPNATLAQKGAALLAMIVEATNALKGLSNPQALNNAPSGSSDKPTDADKKASEATKSSVKVPKEISDVSEKNASALQEARGKRLYEQTYKGDSVDKVEPKLQKSIADYNASNEEYKKEGDAVRGKIDKEMEEFTKTLDATDPKAEEKLSDKSLDLWSKHIKPVEDKWDKFAKENYGSNSMYDVGRMLGVQARVFMKAKEEFVQKAIDEKMAKDKPKAEEKK